MGVVGFDEVLYIHETKQKERKNMHSKEYVIKIIEECGYTTYEAMRQVMEYTGSIVKGLQAVSYLRQYKAKDIRKILQHNK